jgi:hypothetical protein
MYHYHSKTDNSRSFEILKVHGSNCHESLVKCEVIESRLGQAEYAYEEMSYFGGSGMRSRPVFCDGETLLVTESYETVLRRFRYRTENLSL